MAKTLKELRRNKKITEKQMAAICGIHENTYRLWEHNTAKIPIGAAYKIAKTLGTKLENISFC